MTTTNLKETALKDFKELLEEGILTQNFDDISDLEAILSEMFEEKMEYHTDAQEAYDDLDMELNNKLSKYFVYTLGTQPWSVQAHKTVGENFEKYSAQWKEYYSTKGSFNNFDDLCSTIEHRVMKDMSNCGCDCKTALSNLCDDVFDDEHPFYIDLGDNEPKISFLDI